MDLGRDRAKALVKMLASRCSIGGALALASLVLASAAHADATAERAEAERLATTLYYEGVPYAEAEAVGAAGAERLVEMLEQPVDVSHHAQALLILGIAARPGAYEALAGYAAAAPQGELDSARFRALRVLPVAMGHLARIDPRALAWLAERARRQPQDPGFERGALRGERLGRVLREAAVMGLGIAGTEEAAAVLGEFRTSRARSRSSEDGGLAEIVEEAARLSNELRSRGAREVHGGALR